MFRKRDQPRLWRATFAVVGWTALALQYLLMVAPVVSMSLLADRVSETSVAPLDLETFAPETNVLFRSVDGTQRRLRVETFGGATWLSDFAALTGLSTRDLGTIAGMQAVTLLKP